MADEEKVKRISKLLNDLRLSDYTKDELSLQIDNMTITEIKEFTWKLKCFVDDVCCTLDYD